MSGPASTIVRRLLDEPPTRLDEQVALVLFAVTFTAGCALVQLGRVLNRAANLLP